MARLLTMVVRNPRRERNRRWISRNPVFGNANSPQWFAGTTNSCRSGAMRGNLCLRIVGIETNAQTHCDALGGWKPAPMNLHRQEYSHSDPYPNRDRRSDDGQPQWTGAGKLHKWHFTGSNRDGQFTSSLAAFRRSTSHSTCCLPTS